MTDRRNEAAATSDRSVNHSSLGINSPQMHPVNDRLKPLTINKCISAARVELTRQRPSPWELLRITHSSACGSRRANFSRTVEVALSIRVCHWKGFSLRSYGK